MEQEQSWKELLIERCHDVIINMPDDFLNEEDEEYSEPPALYQFYEELLSMRSEIRKVNRRTADAFASFGDVLEGMQSDSVKLRESLVEQSSSGEGKSGASRNLALSMVDLLDRVNRIEHSVSIHAQKGWSGMFSSKAFSSQQGGAISILSDHLEKLLNKVGVLPLGVKIGDVFDPLKMKAVEKVSSETVINSSQQTDLVVSEICLLGYEMGEHILRSTEVKLTHKKR